MVLEPIMRTLMLTLLVLTAAACGTAPSLDTETFELQHVDAEQAAVLIEPYVFSDRPDAPGSVRHSGNMLTVRETRDNLDKIRRVLQDIDRSRPTVRLHFQLIEADGSGPADPAIAEVEAELRKLFRYEGYRLLHQAVVGGTEGSRIEQVVGRHDDAEAGYILIAAIGSVRSTGDSGTVQLEVGVRNPMRGALMTTVNARAGQTLVVGNAQIIHGGGTLILTVRPEFIR
jgi:hypothetical protein